MGAPTTISRVKSATDTETHDVSVHEAIDAIRTGGTKTKGLVLQIRNRFEAELAITGDRKKAKLAVDRPKRQLPRHHVEWHVFGAREQQTCSAFGPTLRGFGRVRHRLARYCEILKTSPHLWALYLSPTADGLKAVFRVPADASQHLESFRAIDRHILSLTGVHIDESCKDVSRLCFMSYDPDVYINVAATEIELLPRADKSKPIRLNGKIDLHERQRIATDILGAIDWQTETSGFVLCPGKHLHTTGNGTRDCKIDFDGVPTVHCFHNSCRGILDGVNHEIRSRIGRAEREARTEQTTKDNSYNSFAPVIDDFPHPPSRHAFHGLAGEIVRRIEPHTEAAPLAILIQTLVAFGSAIGRAPFATVESSRHYGNLNAVLVGESSKARKGTSWNYVLRIFERADETWRKGCIANGLASGEGLIWSVRDPIEETKAVKEKGKYTGTYETVITDQGVTDKRLCVQEGEFANVLKVMAREGNTLSPVLRSAWDSGHLRSLTKNFPAKATDAHISIVGHITRGELCRLLTETESANGFANRFLWVAVRRSKCLPEGGNIESGNLNDLVTRLFEAIDFARKAGEIKRSDAARKLSAKVYPRLSEGRPGLLGAMTARAEAQVLRISILYGLLDCSRTVEPEHLRAALALWNYCERSAYWIFGTATGDPNADKILAALREASGEGLTRTQILEDVCKRNLSADAVDSVLRLLQRSGQAYTKSEKTATKPRERWLFTGSGYEFYEFFLPDTPNHSYNSLSSAQKSDAPKAGKDKPMRSPVRLAIQTE